MKTYLSALRTLVLLGLALGMVATCRPAIHCDGVDDYVTMGTALTLGASNFTVMAWVKRDGAGSTFSSGSGGVVMEPIVCKLIGEADGSNLDGNYAIGYDPSAGNLAADFESYSAAPNNNPVSGGTALDTKWHHIAITFDGFNFLLFLDGVIDGTSTSTQVPRSDSLQHFGIGRALNSSGTATGAWNGRISNVAVWQTPLTSNQVQQIFLARGKHTETQIRPDKLLGFYPLDEFPDGATMSGSGTIKDLGRVGPTGTPTSSPTSEAETVLSY